MHELFNPERLKIARLRRKMSFKTLAELSGLTTKTLSKYENDGIKNPPTPESMTKVAKALQYPVSFFYQDEIDTLSTETVSFRALSKMTAAQRDAAISAGRLSFVIEAFIQKHFDLPQPDLPDLRNIESEMAAEAVREHWGLGNKSIKNLVHLLESKGVRVFSLSENTLDVDAFSFWKNDIPYIFLNNKKSAEHSRFDAAHELGHLVLHKHASPFDSDEPNSSRSAEQEADDFASAFLMPASSVHAVSFDFLSLETIIEMKKFWAVSVLALIVRLKRLRLLTEWQYRKLMQEASTSGFRKKEPFSVQKEKSMVFEKILPMLAEDGINIKTMANQLHLPLDEVTNLVFLPSVIA